MVALTCEDLSLSRDKDVISSIVNYLENCQPTKTTESIQENTQIAEKLVL